MEKFLMLNCHDATILKNDPEAFSAYGAGTINCHDMLITSQMQKVLAEHGIAVNCHDISVLDINTEIIALPENSVIDMPNDWKGKYIFAKGNLVIRPEGVCSLDGIEGIHVSGTLFYPQSYKLTSIAREAVAYPDDMEVITGDKHIKATDKLKKDGSFFIYGTLRITDDNVAEYVLINNNRFACGRFFTYEGVDKKIGDRVKRNSSKLVPDGYAIVKDITLDATAAELHGDKIYVENNLTLKPRNTRCLDSFTSLIIDGKSSIPMGTVKKFKDIAQAKEIFVYEGEYISANGQRTISHDELQGAIKAGIGYTFNINGMLEIAEDVTVEDLECIYSISVNGMIIAQDGIKAILNTKIDRLNGMIKNKVTDNDDMSGIPGMDTKGMEPVMMNMHDYVLI